MHARAVLPLMLAALLLSGCEFLFPPSALETALERCDLSADPSAAYRAASARLIDAAEAGTVRLASDRWFVGYAAAPSLGSAARSRPTDAAAVRAVHGLELARSLAPGLDLVRPTGDPIATARRMLTDPHVRFIHPDVALATVGAIDDPRLADQWHLTSFGLPAAWDLERGDASVVVAVLDSGVDLSHPDLVGRLDPGWDFYDGDPDPGTTDAHGTHVTGIVGAIGGNGIGGSGVAPSGVRLLPVKIFDDTGQASSIGTLVDALRWIAGESVAGPAPLARPVRIANLSLGTSGAYDVVPALEEAIRTARRAGVLVLAASGNESSEDGVIAPANGPCAVAIGSVDESLALSSFSNYDADRRLVDLVGPGGGGEDRTTILSTVPGGYGYLSGTSMSTPWVAGVAALLASQNPGWTAEDLLRALLAGAWRPAEGTATSMGFGLPCPDALLGAGTVCGR